MGGLVAAALAASLCVGSPLRAQLPVGVQARGKIKHVVIVVQENRTFDNIFGGLAANAGRTNFQRCPSGAVPYPGADAVFGDSVASYMQCGQYGSGSGSGSHDAWQCLHDSPRPFSSQAWLTVYHGGEDGCTYGGNHYGQNLEPFYYLANDLRRSYWDIARKYVLGDRFFAISSTSSFPGHQYIVADQSVDTDGDIVADQPLVSSTGQSSGCADTLAPGDSIVVPRLGRHGYIEHVNRGIGGQCYRHETLADLMDRKNVSWTHYTTVKWDDSQHAFVHSGVFDGFINFEQWYRQTDRWPTSLGDLQRNIANGNLASVTWVKPPCIALSDHPAGASTNDAANWVPSVINWIGGSPLWNDTAIFVVWDDWGGFYDHVVPPPIRTHDRLGPGVRTPFLVISPYGVNGSVVHTQADYASVLKFVEDLFDLGSLTPTDANASDLGGSSTSPGRARSAACMSGSRSIRTCAGRSPSRKTRSTSNLARGSISREGARESPCPRFRPGLLSCSWRIVALPRGLCSPPAARVQADGPMRRR